MHISCAFPSIIAGSRRKLLFANYGGIINSEDFELFLEGTVTSGALSAISHQNFELYNTGHVNMGILTESTAGYDFENMESETNPVIVPSFIVSGPRAQTSSSGVLYPSYFSNQSFESFSLEGTLNLYPPMSGTIVAASGSSLIHS